MKNIRKVIFYFLIAGSLSSFNEVLCQSFSNYSVEKSAVSYQKLSNSAISPALSSGNLDEGYYNNISLPFDFWYMGNRYTQFSVSTNGWIAFNTSINSPLPDNSLANADFPVLAPLWDDVRITKFSYICSGSAPARKLVLEFDNVYWNKNSSAPVISFQVVLYETSNNIEFWYRSEAGTYRHAGPGGSTNGASAGLASGSNQFLSLSGFESNSEYSLTEEFSNIKTKPSTSIRVKFTPAFINAPTNLILSSGCYKGEINLSWNDNSGNETSYHIYYSPNPDATIEESNNVVMPANTSNALIQGLDVGITYYFRVFAVAESVSLPATGEYTINHIEYPLILDFSDPDNCWQIIQVAGGGNWEYVSALNSPSIVPQTGNGVLQFRASDFQPGTISRLLSPDLDFTNPILDNPYGRVDFSIDNSNLDKLDRVEIYVSIDNGNTWGDAIRVLHRRNKNANEPRWGSAFFDLSSFIGEGNLRIAVDAISENGSSLAIDQVSIFNNASCRVPSNLQFNEISNSSVNLTWNAVQGSDTYKLRYAEKAIFPYNFTHIDVTNNSATINDLKPNTTYVWYVRSQCGSESIGYQLYPSEFTLSEGVPSCIKPHNLNSIGTGLSSAILTWDSLNAESLRIRYFINGIIPREFKYVNLFNCTSYNLTGLEPGKEYGCEIASICNNTSSGYSNRSFFTTEEGVLSCVKPYNLNSDVISSTSVVLSWDTISAESLRIRYFERDLSPRELKYANIANSTSFLLTGLLPGIEYGWEIASFCDGVSEGYSSRSFFTTENLIEARLNLIQDDFASDNATAYIYPNPASTFINIIINNIEPTQKIVVRNIFSNVVIEALVNPDSDLTTINIQDLYPGVYFIEVAGKVTKIIKE